MLEESGDAWFCLDGLFRSVSLLHLIALSIEYSISVARATSHKVAYNLHRIQTLNNSAKRPTCRLLTCWVLAVILSLSPFIWYHSTNTSRESNLRKLVVCVFLLTFLIPVLTLVLLTGLVIRAYGKIKIFSNTKTDLDPTSKFLLKKGSMRNSRNSSLRRSVSGISRRGSHRRSGGGSMRNRRSARSTNRASPQLDRHPSVRYSIRRRSNDEAADRQHNSTQGLIDPGYDKTLTVRDNNGFGQARLSVDLIEPVDVHSAALLQADRRDSGRSGKSSSRSSKSDKFLDSPKLDRHPSLRFSTRRKPEQGGSGRKSPSRVDVEPLLPVDQPEQHGPDPYSLLSSLQRAHRRLVSQTSSPDAYSWNEPSFFPSGSSLRPSSSVRHKAKSREEVGGLSLSRKSSQRRSTSLLARRSSSRRDWKRPHSVAPESPKLDRHPSLRYSTKRQSHPPSGGVKKERGTASSLSIAYTPVCVADGNDTHREVCLSIGKRSDVAHSPGGSVLSIGTCHDLLLQPSTSSSSVRDRHVQLTAACTAVVQQQQQLDHHNHISAISPSDAASLANRLHVANSDRDVTVQGSTTGLCPSSDLSVTNVRRSLGEDQDGKDGTRLHRFGGGSQRASSRRSFQRDTTHKVEDWLSLESKGPKRLSVRDKTSPEAVPTVTPTVVMGGFLLGASADSLKKKSSTHCSANSLQQIINGDQLNPTDHRLIKLFIVHRSEFRILLSLFVSFVLCNLPWQVVNLVAVFCRSCWFNCSTSEAARRSVGEETLASLMFLSFQTLTYLGVVCRPLFYHLFSAQFRSAFSDLIHCC